MKVNFTENNFLRKIYAQYNDMYMPKKNNILIIYF